VAEDYNGLTIKFSLILFLNETFIKTNYGEFCVINKLTITIFQIDILKKFYVINVIKTTHVIKLNHTLNDAKK
jgi:hypothetical protein